MKRNILFRSLCSALCLLLLGSCTKDEDITTGTISGVVYATSGADNVLPIAGARVNLLNQGQSSVTGTDGSYSFPNIEAGDYRLEVNVDGYQTQTRSISLLPGAKAVADFHLSPVNYGSKLKVDVTSLNFGTQTNSLSFNITNEGNTSLQWTISGNENANWLEFSPSTGTLAAGKSHAVVVNLLRNQLTESRSVTVIVGSGEETHPITITAAVASTSSKIQLSSNTLDFGTSYSSLSFSIKNIGNSGNISWSISGKQADWYTVSPTQGTTAMGKSSAVQVNIDRSKISSTVSETIIVNADGESLPITLLASKTAEHSFEVTPTSLDFGNTTNQLTLTLNSYNGNTDFELLTTGEAGWLSFNEIEGTVPSNANRTIIAYADRSKLTAGQHSCTLIVRTDLGDTRIPISIYAEENGTSGGNETEDPDASEQIVETSHSDITVQFESCKRNGSTVTVSFLATNNTNTTKNYMLYCVRWGNGTSISDDVYNTYKNETITIGTNSSTNYAYYEIPAKITIRCKVEIREVAENAQYLNLILGSTIGSRTGETTTLRNIHID